MCFSPQIHPLFRHQNFKKCSEPDMFCTFSLQKCASRHSGVQFLISPVTTWLRTRRFALTGLLFDWPDTRIIEKTQHFATSLTFGADVSSFFWLSRYCIFFLLTWLLYSAFQLSILSEVRVLCASRHECSELQKSVRCWRVLYIFTSKFAFRHTACNFSTSELLKCSRTLFFFLNILTSKCASRHSSVQFSDVRTSKSAPGPSIFFGTFWLQNVLRSKKCSRIWSFFCTLWLQNALRATVAFDIWT